MPSISPSGWQINNGTLNPSGPANPLPPIGGSFDAVANGVGGPRSITQAFVVPASVPRATLSWSDRIQNFANAFADPTQEFRVQILDAAGAVLQTVYSTNPGDPPMQIGPNGRSFDVTTLLQSRAGQTIRLRFEEQDSLNFFTVTVDNISLVVDDPAAGPADDFYSLNLAAGQTVNLALGLSNFAAADQLLPRRAPTAPCRPRSTRSSWGTAT